MTDALLTQTDREEALSRVYARAVAAAAGYAISEYDFDRDGIDLSIHAGGRMRPTIESAGKGNCQPQSTNWRVLSVSSERSQLYNLLRIPTYTPRLLVVLDLPKVEDRWITITSDELILRRSAYWLNLNGCEETDNQASVTVMIPENNLFDLDGLRSLMEQSRRGNI